VALGSNLNSLTAGTYLTGTAYNGSGAQTWTVDATSTNTVSKVVARDGSGNFAAGTITAALSGNATTATTATTATNVSGTVAVANGGTGTTSLTANNVILGNGTSAVQVVAPGTTGNVLTSNGTTWQSSDVPRGWVFLSTLTASNSTSINFTSLISSTYENYVVIINSMNPQTGSTTLTARVSINNGSTWISTNYRYNSFDLTGNTPGYAGGGSVTSLSISDFAVVPTTAGLSGQVLLFDLPAAGTIAKFLSQITYATRNSFTINSGSYQTAASINAVQFLMSSGNITSGTFSLYGIKD
jgi:hypothetical protein